MFVWISVGQRPRPRSLVDGVPSALADGVWQPEAAILATAANVTHRAISLVFIIVIHSYNQLLYNLRSVKRHKTNIVLYSCVII